VGLLIALLTLVLVGLVLAIVSAPLRRARASSSSEPARDLRAPAGAGASVTPAGAPAALQAARVREELEAAREAKYREIRDAELDYRTGKLSAEDYRAIDADLRTEAIEILNRLERLKPRDA